MNRVGVESSSARIEELQSHESDLPNNANMLGAIIGGRADGSSAMAAVTGVVLGITGIIDRVDAKDVVDVAVIIIVDVVAGNFARVDPHLGGQIAVGIIDARINDADDDVGIAGGDIPSLDDVDVGAGEAALLADVVQAPESSVDETAIGGREIGMNDVVRLDVFEKTGPFQLANGFDQSSRRLRFGSNGSFEGGLVFEFNDCDARDFGKFAIDLNACIGGRQSSSIKICLVLYEDASGVGIATINFNAISCLGGQNRRQQRQGCEQSNHMLSSKRALTRLCPYRTVFKDLGCA